MNRLPLGRVHLVADLDTLESMEEPLERVGALLAAGLESLQLRAPGHTATERLRWGAALADLARAGGARFVVNEDVDLALALGADGVHLPARAPRPAEVRARVPSGFLVGATAHDAGELRRAEGADWVTVSPVFATRSNPGVRPLEADGRARLVAASAAPVYALGGITAATVATCLDAGAAGVAAIRGLLEPGGEDLLEAARSWRGHAR